MRVLRAHVEGLAHVGLIGQSDCQKMLGGLDAMRTRAAPESPAPQFEDVYEHIEYLLRESCGAGALWRSRIGKARNDSAVTSLKLWTRENYRAVGVQLCSLIEAFLQQARANPGVIMPGFTHGQVAQPIAYAHYCLAYAQMFMRDLSKLLDGLASLDECPLGSAALAGTSLPLDRTFLAQRLGFSRPTDNTLDAVSDRDFVMDACYVISSIGLHLSRLAEELILWSSPEHRMFTLPQSLITGSSILPHKRNPDALELVRGKTARTVANLNRIQVLMKSLPLGYLRDMQEDKEALFDSFDTAQMCLHAAICCIQEMQVDPLAMARTVANPAYLSSDLVDSLIRKHGISKEEAFARVTSALNDPGAYARLLDGLDANSCVAQREVIGGTSPRAIEASLTRLAYRAGETRSKLDQLPV